MSVFDDGEFLFELRMCAWAERNWPPGTTRAGEQAVLVGRQVGTRRRRWDTVLAVGDREALKRRADFGERELDSDLLRVVRNAPAEWAWYRDVLPQWAPWRYVREHVTRAAERGLVDRRKNSGRVELRRRQAYPDWCDRLIAIENKPDLDASAADALADQLHRDVALGLADEVWVATKQTGEAIEPALLTERPPEAGVLAFAPQSMAAEVLWHPQTLPVDKPGTRIEERPSGDAGDLSAARFSYVDPETKRHRRRVLAERVYGRGFRSFVDSMRPDCRWFQLREEDRQLLPYCASKERLIEARECTGSCPVFEPEPPTWRTKGWPIEGGPGTLQQRLLADRRTRGRPRDGEKESRTDEN